MRGTFSASSRAWTYVVRLFGAGLLDLASLVSHSFPLEAMDGALRTLTESSGRVGKILLLPAESDARTG